MYLGLNSEGVPICIDPTDLLTHGVILGRTGSGKSGLTIAVLEEVAASGSSAIVFDPKGDLTNLALPLVNPKEFKDWVDPNLDHAELYAQAQRGLAVFGLNFGDVWDWRKAVDIKLFAPGKTYGGGKPLNVFPTFAPPRRADLIPPRESATKSVATVLRALGEGHDPYAAPLVYMVKAVMQAWSRNEGLPVEFWPGVLTEPSGALGSFGGMGVEEFFPKKQRLKLARTVIGFHQQAERWLAGPQLDLHGLVAAEKPTVFVFSMRHLSEEDRFFFTSIVMQRLVEFMFETAASQKLKLLCVLDEARGYLPPYPKNPPTKDPICTLLAQGRAQGIGMLIGTQNPMDLDYKALSNVGTWFVGRLRERDCARDLLAELKSRGVEAEQVRDLTQRNFLLLDKRGGSHNLQVRWCFSHLRGPLGSAELADLSRDVPPRPEVPRT